MVQQICSEGELEMELKLAGDKLVVVDFTATWCPPCRAIAPKFQELADNQKDVVFLKVDIDVGQELAAKYEVRAVPTFIFFKNREKVDTIRGANFPGLLQKIKDHK